MQLKLPMLFIEGLLVNEVKLAAKQPMSFIESLIA
jgi:hypothetical protein